MAISYSSISDVQSSTYDKLCELSGEEVARLFTNFYGMQLVDPNFAEFLVDEGYADYEEVGLEEEEEYDDE